MQSLRQQKTNLKEKENLTKSDIKQTSNLRPSTTKNNIKKETLNKGSKIDEKKTLKTDININQEDEDIVCEKKEQ